MHVTVLIPVYNRERFIRDAIDSVIAQDYRDWDIVIVDDGSTDHSVDVVKSRMTDDRIAMIRTQHSGTTAAYTVGIDRARGPVITTLDSDDKLMPDALSSVMPVFQENPKLGYVWTKWVESTGIMCGDFLPEGKTLFQALISGWFNCCHQRFFRKEFYMQTERLDTSIKYSEDVQLALLIAETGCDTLHIPKVTYCRRSHPHQITNELHTELSESSRTARRKFGFKNMTNMELYISGLEKEIHESEAVWSELQGIKKCFGYKLMRYYGSIIDRALPDDTKRGRLKRNIISQIRGS